MGGIQGMALGENRACSRSHAEAALESAAWAPPSDSPGCSESLSSAARLFPQLESRRDAERGEGRNKTDVGKRGGRWPVPHSLKLAEDAHSENWLKVIPQHGCDVGMDSDLIMLSILKLLCSNYEAWFHCTHASTFYYEGCWTESTVLVLPILARLICHVHIMRSSFQGRACPGPGPSRGYQKLGVP